MTEQPEEGYYWWAYRCSLCGETFAPEAVSDHVDEEQRKPDWPGYVRLDRVDQP